MHKDRLARFGYDLLKLFQKFGVKLVVHNTCSQALQGTREQELSEDLLAIIVFVASNNGSRAGENRRNKNNAKKAKQRKKRKKKKLKKTKILIIIKNVVELRSNIYIQCVLSR